MPKNIAKQKRPEISGKDYMAFLSNPIAWPKGVYEDDVLLIVDGKECVEGADLVFSDDSVIVIESGDVFDSNDGDVRLHSLQEHYNIFMGEQASAKAGELTHIESLASNMIFDEIHRLVCAAGLTPSADDAVTAKLGAAIESYIAKCRTAPSPDGA